MIYLQIWNQTTNSDGFFRCVQRLPVQWRSYVLRVQQDAIYGGHFGIRANLCVCHCYLFILYHPSWDSWERGKHNQPLAVVEVREGYTPIPPLWIFKNGVKQNTEEKNIGNRDWEMYIVLYVWYISVCTCIRTNNTQIKVHNMYT